MARPNPRIDVIKRVGRPIAFSVHDRLAIEAKYGHKLTSEQWQQITDVTSELTILIPGIKVATRVRVVLPKFKKLEAAAKSLRNEFNETPLGSWSLSRRKKFTGPFLLVVGNPQDSTRSFNFS